MRAWGKTACVVAALAMSGCGTGRVAPPPVSTATQSASATTVTPPARSRSPASRSSGPQPVLCLPRDGLCVDLPAGWVVADTELAGGEVAGSALQRGDAPTDAVALGPSGAQLRLRGAPAGEPSGCASGSVVRAQRPAHLSGVSLATIANGSRLQAALVRDGEDPCAPYAQQLRSPLPGRVVTAQATASQGVDLDAIAVALVDARWR